MLARDPVTGEVSYQPIEHVIVTADKEASDLRLERDGVDETLGVTREHPFWVRDQGWVKAYRLAPGDHVFTESGAWARVVSNTPRTTRQYVYNLSVADDHTFFVGKVGAWVHNCAWNSHRQMVRALGKAGPGQAWHHIVEQTPRNVARFGAQAIHNTRNVIRLPHGAGTLCRHRPGREPTPPGSPVTRGPPADGRGGGGGGGLGQEVAMPEAFV